MTVPLRELVEYALAVRQMRAAQRAYFDSRHEPARVRDERFRQARQLEARVDRLTKAAVARESAAGLFDAVQEMAAAEAAGLPD